MRHISGLPALGLMMAVAVACAESLAGPGAESQVEKEIRYSLAPVKTVTRADATFSSFPADSAFGTTAYFLPKGRNWLGDHGEAVIYIGTEKVSKKEDVWKAWGSGKVYYWPRAGSLSFFSWAPYNLRDRGLTVDKENGLQIKGWSVRNEPGYGGNTDYGKSAPEDGSVDILLARTSDVSGSSNTDATGNGVKILFSHALCKVRFEISLDNPDPDENKKWVVEKVELKDICTKGDYSGGQWGNQSEPRGYIPGNISDETPIGPLKAGEFKEIFPWTMMIPQPVSSSSERNPRIEVTCWDGVSMKEDKGKNVPDTYIRTGVLYTNNSDLLRWKEGSRITYRLYIPTGSSDDNFIEFDAAVDEWTEKSGSEDIIIK